MKKNITLLSIILLAFASGCTCSEFDPLDSTPCLKARISESQKKEMDATTIIAVKRFSFQNQTVFVLEPSMKGGADISTEVVDDQCNTLGHLGGISGNTTINGDDFSKAIFEATLWESE